MFFIIENSEGLLVILTCMRCIDVNLECGACFAEEFVKKGFVS
jgi:hypothetical protein